MLILTVYTNKLMFFTIVFTNKCVTYRMRKQGQALISFFQHKYCFHRFVEQFGNF